MRILFIHPNYHSGGTEIAGNWPLDWIAYLSGALRKAGYNDVKFIDAMTVDIGDEALRREAAIVRHASTFAEAGAFTCRFLPSLTLQLKGSPICRGLRMRDRNRMRGGRCVSLRL